METTITVHPAPAGGGSFGPGLEMSRDSRPAPLTPEMVNGFCWPIEAKPVPTYEAAKVAARSYLADALDPAHAQEWHDLPALNDPDLIDEVVFTAFADNRPGAALAASLRGHELAPYDPVHLSNAAAAANRLERPEWAVAFAREAGNVGPGPSVGIQQEAVRLATIGHAWALMWQMDKAEETLRQALLLDPENPHLHQELGAILACQANKGSEALPHVRRGLRRDNAADPMETGTGAHRASWRTADDLFDLSGATRPNQIVLPALPASLHELLGMGPTFVGGSGYYEGEAKRIQDPNLALILREQECSMNCGRSRTGFIPPCCPRPD